MRFATDCDPVCSTIGLAEIAAPVTTGCFGVGLDQDARIWMFGLRIKQHLPKAVQIASGGFHAGIASGLVDHQHITWFGWGQAGIGRIVFRQMEPLQLCHGTLGTAQKARVIKRVLGQQDFQIARNRRVEMHAAIVDM